MEKERGETHVRATTMYFGAALHTPCGGQCPSLLRPKEGAGSLGGGRGREGRRGRGRETEGKHGAEKMNKRSGRPEKGREVSLYRPCVPPSLSQLCVSR